MTGRKIAAIAVGVLGLLIGVALVSGATTMLSVDRDADGFYLSDEYTFAQPSYAIASEDIENLTDAPAWLMDWITDPVDLRITGATVDDAMLFLGVGPSGSVQQYLSGVAYHEVTDLSFDNRAIADVTYVPHDGDAPGSVPGAETFWSAWTQGPGTQVLDWDIESGSWTVVVMNADATSGVEADLAIGARISNITAISWIAMAIGVLFVLGFGYLTFRGFRRPDSGMRVVDLREDAVARRPKEPVA